MQIKTLMVGMIETNCYLVYDRPGGEGVIIDPGAEADRIIAEITRLGFTPRAVLLTHGHGDHIGAVPEIIGRLKLPLYAGKGEESMLASPEENLSAEIGFPVSCTPCERLLTDGEKLVFGSLAFTVLKTPGHSPGGVCYLSDQTLFCGDTLFCGSIGRTDFPGCSHKRLIASITEKLLVLPDDTVCYPGHGPTTTIGDERRDNPFLTGGYFV